MIEDIRYGIIDISPEIIDFPPELDFFILKDGTPYMLDDGSYIYIV